MESALKQAKDLCGVSSDTLMTRLCYKVVAMTNILIVELINEPNNLLPNQNKTIISRFYIIYNLLELHLFYEYGKRLLLMQFHWIYVLFGSSPHLNFAVASIL